MLSHLVGPFAQGAFIKRRGSLDLPAGLGGLSNLLRSIVDSCAWGKAQLRVTGAGGWGKAISVRPLTIYIHIYVCIVIYTYINMLTLGYCNIALEHGH